MKFSYQARTEEGEIQAGFVEASSQEAALAVLQKYGLYVTYLSEVKEPFWQRRVDIFRRISKGDIVFFTSLFSIMLKSNIPVVESLETIASQTKKPRLREIILKIAEEIEGGATLSQAFSAHPQYFSSFYIGMVKSGEISGKVPESLDYLADYLKKEQDFASRLTLAMVYPVFVSVVFFAVMLVMGIIVVPRFKEVFVGMEADLPLITRITFGLSDLIRKGWPILLFCFFGFGILISSSFKSREAKKFLDKISLEIPLINDFLTKFLLARVALNLSTLISGGISISRALEITADVVGNDVYRSIVLKTQEGVRAGKSMSSVLSSYPERFPPLFIRMTVVGERTGHLEKTLKNVVDIYQKEVDRALEGFITLLEPLLIIILGGMVALLCIALFVPLFQQGITI